MPILPAELIAFLPASVPTNDTGTSGGAIDTTGRPAFTQWSANAVAAAISDGADVRNLTLTGRLITGVIDTEVLVLTGAVEVVGAKVWERLLSAVLSAGDAARTVSVRQGSGGTVRATLTPNETARRIMFYDSTSEAAEAVRHEKEHLKNTHATLALTNAEVKLTADPSARIMIGVAAAKGDSVSVANRKAVPGGITFVDDNIAAAVPSGNLGAGESIGVWIKQALPGSDPAAKTTYTLALSGQTT